MRLSELGEFGFIREVTGDLPQNDERVLMGVGDDAAVFRTEPGTVQLVSTDTLVEGIDFLLHLTSPRQLGHKALAVNLSDMAAMGARPTHALVTIAAPSSLDADCLRECYAGLKALALLHDVSIIGGDMSASPHDLTIGVTILGAARPEHVVYRSGAKPGDAVLLVGHAGESAAGLKILLEGHEIDQQARDRLIGAHLEPRPLVAEGAWLAQSGFVRAMIDVSDGIVPDLGHICERSGVSARIAAESVPISPELAAFAQATGADAMRLALTGGEDFALLVTVAPENADELMARFREEFDTPVAAIGSITEGAGVTVEDETGREMPMGRGIRALQRRIVMAGAKAEIVRTCKACKEKTSSLAPECPQCGVELPRLTKPQVSEAIARERRGIGRRAASYVGILVAVAVLAVYFHYVFLPESRAIDGLRGRISQALESQDWAEAERVANEIMKHHPERARAYLRHIRDSRIIARNTYDFTILDTWQLHGTEVVALVATPDGRHMISQDATGLMLQWSLADGRISERREGVPVSPSTSAFTPNGRNMLAVDPRTGDAVLTEFPSGRGRARLPHSVPITALGISADARLGLSADTTGTVRIWRMADAHLLNRLPCDTMRTTALAFTANADTIVTGSADGRVSLWSVR